MKIERIEVFPVEYPTVGRFKFLEGPKGEPLGRRTALVKITADTGRVGWGESVPSHRWSYETLESVTGTIQTYLAPVLLGRDAFDIAGIHEVMNRTIGPGFSTGMPICKAGIDLALHDLCSRALGISLAEYWGRPQGGMITLSWTLNPASLDDLEASLEDGWQRGYRNFNVKVAPDPDYDLELCKRVKERVPDGFLWADANGGYDLTTALQVAPKLADLGVDILECPIRPNRLSGYQQLRAQGALPITMDEGVLSTGDLVEFIRLGMLDGLTIKPARCGGLFDARCQIETVLDAGMFFLGSGLTEPDVGLSASLALYAAYGLSTPAALNGPQYLTKSVLRTPYKPVNGQLPAPQGPGMGFEIDEAELQNLSIEV